jgi:hypothetical protein
MNTQCVSPFSPERPPDLQQLHSGLVRLCLEGTADCTGVDCWLISLLSFSAVRRLYKTIAEAKDCHVFYFLPIITDDSPRSQEQ